MVGGAADLLWEEPHVARSSESRSHSRELARAPDIQGAPSICGSTQEHERPTIYLLHTLLFGDFHF